MGAAGLLFAAFGLAMDAFAVSVCKGMAAKRIQIREMITLGVFFGSAQAIMPCVGWLLGIQFQKYIESVDHWVAFILLDFIGGKMICDTLSDERQTVTLGQRIDYKELVGLAAATSVDALAVGITFAFLDTNVILSSAVIGAVTFVLTAIGFTAGVYVGDRFGKGSGICGGSVLIVLGFKILFEDLLTG